MSFDPFLDPFRVGLGASTADIFRRRSGGVRRAKPLESQAEAEPEAEAAPAEEKGEEREKVVLKNPKWEAEEVGFNEETDISVEATLPASQAHKTKVAFELFAKTPDGPERIGGADGRIQDGKALCRMPIYIPQYRDEAGELLTEVEYWFTAKHAASDLLEDDTVVKKVDRMADLLIESHVLQDVTFATDKSFVRPSQEAALKSLCDRIAEWRKTHAEAKLAVFGHADAVGREDHNKKLSERRSKAIHAFLVKDAKAWEKLYNEEQWGLASTQELLNHLGYDCGEPDGKDGPRTQGAVKDFQRQAGLTASGKADAGTREALYRAFIDRCNSLSLAAGDFDVIDGKPHAGCSEYNLKEKTDGACEKNRRVAVFLLKSNKNFPIQYPCKHGDIGVCRKQVARKGDRRTAGFGCLFYDKLVVEAETPPPKPVPAILSLAWEKPWVLAWDDEDLPEMKTKVKVKTELVDPGPACLEVHQMAWKEGEEPSLYKSFDVTLEGDVLKGEDGKEFEFKAEWHDSIYDHGRTQYFLRLKAGDLTRTSGKSREFLLQLKHYDGIIGDPSGDLPGAAQEAEWFRKHAEKKGPWMEAVERKLVADGHKAKKLGACTTAGMAALVERNKFLHHQSSHGTAYCMCDGNKNYVEKTKKKGADGSLEYACPVCGCWDQAMGCIFLKDWDNLFFDAHVQVLDRAPKVLLLSNCCLTAITDRYPSEWLTAGTRWYIGWALPVGDADAVNFAKAFYRRWWEHYEMDPDKVGEAFNDVKGPYAKYRPRIFGS